MILRAAGQLGWSVRYTPAILEFFLCPRLEIAVQREVESHPWVLTLRVSFMMGLLLPSGLPPAFFLGLSGGEGD
jgi:hypothetical protein